jgi:hypothetical protein
MTNTTKAPERISAIKLQGAKKATFLGGDTSAPFDATEYIRADHSDALIAAAYDAAARAAFRAGKSVHSGYRDENERLAQRIENELRLEVQAAIRGAVKAGPRAALDRIRQEAREEALREAADRLKYFGAYGAAQIVLDLIEKDQANG